MATKRRTNSAAARGKAISLSAGVIGILAACWLIYGTVTIDPFRWGTFAEELILAFCILFALRLLCVIRLPNWLSIACIAAVSALYVVYGLLFMPGGPASPERTLSLAAAAAFALSTARELDTRPDGTLLAALLAVACMPILFGENGSFLAELMRALVMAGVFMAVLSVRQKSPLFLYFAALGFALGGAVNLYAAFAGAGAGVGAALFSAKKQRGKWALAAVLCGALPLAVWLAATFLFPLSQALYQEGGTSVPEFAAIVETHLLRALDLGLMLLAVRLLIRREDAAVPALFCVAGGLLIGLVPFLDAPDVWMQALPLCVLAGVGTAKAARGKGR